MQNAHTSIEANPKNPKSFAQKASEVLLLLGIIYVFLVSLELMGASFKLFGKDFAESLVASTSNPFIGLFIGILATAIIQSSSTTTSIVVAIVASGAYGAGAGPETISLAVFIIMGANIGTSVTSTIVSLGHIRKREEFQRAIAGATVHDFFNIITVILLFPLELMFGILSKPAAYLANLLFVGGGSGGFLDAMKFVKHSVKPASSGIIDGTEAIFGAGTVIVPIVTTLVAFAILFFALNGLTWSLKRLLIGKIQHKVDKILFGSTLKALGWGTGITTLVQSSSVTTSLTVPLVATGKVSLEKVFPFLMGANIGTTTTALIAAIVSTTAANPIAGLAIAFCHLLFNLIGVFVIYPIPQIRKIPINLASGLGRLTTKNRLYGIGYVVTTFFILPFILILGTQGFNSDSEKSVDAAAKEAPAKTEIIKAQSAIEDPLKEENTTVLTF